MLFLFFWFFPLDVNNQILLFKLKTQTACMMAKLEYSYKVPKINITDVKMIELFKNSNQDKSSRVKI